MVLPLLASIGWPVLDRFRFGSRFAISPHGLGIAIGFMIGGWLLGKLGPKRGVSADHVNTMLFWALIGAIVGSRLFYVIAHVSEFSSPLEWFEVWKGGISLLGGIAGAILLNVPRMRAYGYRFLQVMDPVGPSLALGIAIGRIGDLVIGDHLGKPTSWWFAWTYHGGTLPPPWVLQPGGRIWEAVLNNGQTETFTRAGAKLYSVGGQVIASGVGVHQTALYDMVLAWGLFALLWTLNKRPRREGVLAFTFGLYYGCCRLLEDSLRIDKRFGPFTGSQWTALAVALLSAGTLIAWAIQARRRTPDGGTSPHDEAVPVADAADAGEGSAGA